MSPAVVALQLSLVAVLVMAQPGAASGAALIQDVQTYRGTHEAAIVAQLARLTRLRSVAADPAGLDAAAEELQRQLQTRGFEAALWRDDPASPALVFGSLRSPGARRTVVFYAHYDGQPVTPAQWSSDPFTPVMRSGPGADARELDWERAPSPLDPQWRLYGRAVADDKASIVAFLSAFDALKASGHTPSVNLKVVWDGEEEAGSPHIESILRAHRDHLAGELWLIGDGPVHQSRRATLYFGARGGLGLELTVYGPVRALHDGHYGNWAPNPAAMAAELVSQMRDSEGRILIPGFADDVRAVPPQAQAALAQLPPVEDALKREFGVGRSEGTEGLTASTQRPAINIRGLRAGAVGAEAVNAIPVEAIVSLDFRLVPDQTPARVREKVEAFLRSKGWSVVTATPSAAERGAHPRLVKLAWEAGYPALRTDMSTPVARAVIAAAGHGAGGPVALLPMMGGSVPIYVFADLFHVPVIGVPIVNHDDNQHAANENLRLENLWNGIDTYAALMGELHW